jgi:hypothetical protein
LSSRGLCLTASFASAIVNAMEPATANAAPASNTLFMLQPSINAVPPAFPMAGMLFRSEMQVTTNDDALSIS